jgi:hypothetical protein
VRWWLPSQRNQALLDWEKSILAFRNLALQVDIQNKPAQNLWYEKQAGLMDTSLRQWIVLTKP